MTTTLLHRQPRTPALIPVMMGMWHLLAAALFGAQCSCAFVVTPTHQGHANKIPFTIRTPPETNVAIPLSSSSLHMFGGLFGGGGDTLALDKSGEATVYTSNNDDEFEGLSDFITGKWAKLFETGNIQLTTPVLVSLLEGSDTVRGVRLLFQNVDTGYQNKKEEAAAENDDGTEQPNAAPKKQGGVEIRVEKTDKGAVQVRAQRCEIDDNTVIKEMSEEAILKELKEAIDVWKKEK